MTQQHNARLAVTTCTPMAFSTGPNGNTIYEALDPRWHRARMGLSYGTNINASELCVDGLEIGDARSRVASQCRKQSPKPFCCFFLDSDVIVPQDGFTKLFYHLKTKPHIDIACGVYVVKGAAPFDPLIYQGNGFGAFWDFAVGDILTTKQHGITACHMGLTLIRTSLFDRMVETGLVHGDGTDQDDEPFFKTESYRLQDQKGVGVYKGTEDIYFCLKATKMEANILVDTSVLAGHVDRKSGMVYGLMGNCSPIERAMWMPLPDGSGRRKDRKLAEDNEVEIACEYCNGDGWLERVDASTEDRERLPCPKCHGKCKIKIKKPLLLAIDLGAGESRREWEGYKTYTLDARKDSGADYCQQLPRLNLPDNHYDKVACMAEGSLVITKNGVKCIEDIIAGDDVWTHRSRWRKVTANNKYVPDELCRVVTAGNSRGFYVSTNHPMYVRYLTNRMSQQYDSDLYKKIAMFPEADFVNSESLTRQHLAIGVVPDYIEHRDRIDLAEILPINKSVQDYVDIMERRESRDKPRTEGDFTLSEKFQRTKTQVRGWIYHGKSPLGYHCYDEEILFHSRSVDIRLPRYVEVDGDLMRLVGYYISDGSLTRSHAKQVGFHFNVKETDYIEDVRNIIADKFGITPTDERVDRETNCMKLRYVSKVLHDIITGLVGAGGVHEKKIPAWALWEIPSLQIDLIEGIVRGDGWESESGKRSVTTVSEDLAEGLRLMLLRNGFMPGVYKHECERKPEGSRFRSCGWAYHVNWHPERKNQRGGLVDNGVMVSRIYSVERLPNKSETAVYGLTVEEDESYFAGGVTQHNSRHSFEHIGRWDQELLWSECFRICKPGGSLEVIVPNLEWACQKVANGEMDNHVLNVLYGAQEEDEEVGREHNVHYFGYTPAVLQSLAEGAGFEKIKIVSYLEDPNLGYHMTCTGYKPANVPAAIAVSQHNGVVTKEPLIVDTHNTLPFPGREKVVAHGNVDSDGK